MSGEHPDPIERLLDSIADDLPPDWASAERVADPAQRPRVESLRDLSRIAEFSRTHQRSDDVSGPEPDRWGDLLLLERLSASGHAEVFRAWDPSLQREVALKLMSPGSGDAALLEEGRIAARIRHPHVVTVHGVDRKDGRVGLWMELVRGPTLEQEVRAGGPLDPAAARRLGVEIGGALVAVHAAGLLHRDVKPANLIRDAEGRYVLADFGLGVREDQANLPRRGPSGTPMYMAPELLAGSPASERTDVYSLGLVLWFALAGRHPFVVETLDDLVAAARTGPRPRLRELRGAVPQELVAIVEHAIEPTPEERIANLRTLVHALESWRPSPARSTARLWVLAVAAIVAVGAMVAIGLGRMGSRKTEPTTAVVTPPSTSSPPAAQGYAVEASFLRREKQQSVRLTSGDRVKPGDRLSLEVRTTRPAWVYVLNEDEGGERYLLFPQSRLDVVNPLTPDSTFILPGKVGTEENAWTVTSAGGHEYFLVVVSPEPVAEIEAERDRFAAPRPGRPVAYNRVGDATLERLRGVGGMDPLPQGTAPPSSRSRAFERFRALAGRESGIEGVWVRQVVLENPAR